MEAAEEKEQAAVTPISFFSPRLFHSTINKPTKWQIACATLLSSAPSLRINSCNRVVVQLEAGAVALT